MNTLHEKIDLYIVKVAFGHRPNYELFGVIAALILFVALITGCKQIDDRENLKNGLLSLSYFKDKHGICYAAIENYPYNGNNIRSITYIPCDKAGMK